MKPLLVGQAPSGRAPGAAPLDGPSGRRVARLAGVLELGDAFDAANLLGEFPGKQGKGDAFPAAAARLAAAALDLSGRPLVVLGGRGVAAAFGEGGRAWLEAFPLRGIPAIVVPHPSGVSHWWNCPANAARASLVLRAAAAGKLRFHVKKRTPAP